MSYDLSTDTGLAPILMFHLIRNDNGVISKRGVYYIPQRGVGMIGVHLDGSIRSLARHMCKTPQYIDFKPAAVDPVGWGDDPEEFDEDVIIKAISKWMTRGDETPPEPPVEEETEDDEDVEEIELEDEDEDEV